MHVCRLPEACSYHGIHQALVPISQVGGQPPRGLVDGLVGPLAVGEVNGFELFVFLRGIFEPTRESAPAYGETHETETNGVVSVHRHGDGGGSELRGGVESVKTEGQCVKSGRQLRGLIWMWTRTPKDDKERQRDN